MNNYFTSSIGYITNGPRYNNIIYQLYSTTYYPQKMIVYWSNS